MAEAINVKANIDFSGLMNGLNQIKSNINNFVNTSKVNIQSNSKELENNFKSSFKNISGFADGFKSKMSDTFKKVGLDSKSIMNSMIGMTGATAITSGIGGLTSGLQSLFDAGKKSYQATNDLKIALSQAGVPASQMNDAIKGTNKSLDDLSNKFAIPVSELRSFSTYAASIGGATGQANADLVQLGIGMEKATQGTVKAEQAIKIFSKGVASEEDKANMGRIKNSFSGLAEAMKGATNNGDMLRIAMQYVKPTLVGMEDAAKGPLGASFAMEKQFSKLKTEVGKSLFEAFIPLMQFMASTVVPVIKNVITFLGESGLIKYIGLVVIGIGGLVAVNKLWNVAIVAQNVATGIATAAQWAWNVALNANPIGIIVAALVVLGAAVYGIIKYWDEIKLAIKNVWDTLTNNPILMVITSVLLPIPTMLVGIIANFDDIILAVKKAYYAVTDFLGLTDPAKRSAEYLEDAKKSSEDFDKAMENANKTVSNSNATIQAHNKSLAAGTGITDINKMSVKQLNDELKKIKTELNGLVPGTDRYNELLKRQTDIKELLNQKHQKEKELLKDIQGQYNLLVDSMLKSLNAGKAINDLDLQKAANLSKQLDTIKKNKEIIEAKIDDQKVKDLINLMGGLSASKFDFGDKIDNSAKTAIKGLQQLANDAPKYADKIIDSLEFINIKLKVNPLDTMLSKAETGFNELANKYQEGNASLSELSAKSLETLALTGAAALSNGKDFGKAMLSQAFDMLQAMIPIWSAQILGYAISTKLTWGLVEWVALTAVLTGAVALARKSLGAKEGYMDGVQTLGTKKVGYDTMPVWINPSETILPELISKREKPLLEHLFKGGTSLSYFELNRSQLNSKQDNRDILARLDKIEQNTRNTSKTTKISTEHKFGDFELRNDVLKAAYNRSLQAEVTRL